MTENPSLFLTQKRSAKSSPDDMARIDVVSALVADRHGQGNAPLLAPGANISVEQQFNIFSHCCPAMGTSLILKLEIPLAPTLGTAVMGSDLNIPIGNVFCHRTVVAGVKRGIGIKSVQAELQKLKRSLPFVIHHMDIDFQADAVPLADGFIQLGQQRAKFADRSGIEKGGSLRSDLAKDGNSIFVGIFVHLLPFQARDSLNYIQKV